MPNYKNPTKMFSIVHTNSENKDFQELVKQLDKDLAIRDGDDHEFYAQINHTAVLKYAILIYQNEIPVGCGALKILTDEILEVKRIFVPVKFRGKGIATLIVNELEKWAKNLNYNTLVLETGINQSEAIQLYEKLNYSIIPNYGPYKNLETSICFEKNIK